MTITDAISEYLLTAEREQGMAHSTINTLRSWLTRFAVHAGRQLDTPEAFTLENLRRFRQSHRARPRTVHQSLFAFRSFGNFLIERGHLDENPALALPRPRLDDPVRKYLSDDDCAALLAACERLPGPVRRRIMAKAVISTLLFTGLRREEVCSLKTGDVNLTRPACLQVTHAKGGKNHTAWLNPACAQALAAWLDIRDTPRPCAHAFLFDFQHARRLGYVGLKNLLADLATVAGVPIGRIAPHAFRRKFGELLLEAGINLHTIQQAYNHSSVLTTVKYLRGNQQRTKAAMEAISLPEAAEPRPVRSPSSVNSTTARSSIWL